MLATRPIALTLKAKSDLECTAEQPVQVDIDGTRVFALAPDHSMETAIFCLTLSTEDAGNRLQVSLQKAFGAAPLAGGQKTTLRWGPIWHNEPLFLVVTAEKPTKLLIANPILTSRS